MPRKYAHEGGHIYIARVWVLLHFQCLSRVHRGEYACDHYRAAVPGDVLALIA